MSQSMPDFVSYDVLFSEVLMSAKAAASAELSAQELADKQKSRAFRKFTFRGVDEDKLAVMPIVDVVKLFNARKRRRFSRGIKDSARTLIAKLVRNRKATAYGEKPVPVKTHLRDCIIVPEMVGSICSVYRGNGYMPVEIKPQMVGHYLGEFAITYKQVSHGKGGSDSKFVPGK